ncbi:MAG: hypothetical protein LKI26_00895 [Bifidobacterium tibiigranuli]|jgi:hypothetical protein|uniref:hypothetical protein n=1 Tax=Bifidobacterium tibiigranuli TaxID=2172043 RepID=UPI0026F1D5C2|nr:hypothetical protein [Bifidobacterium tibiigranuli]MCI1649191.1 hypothetical protein [Bifidobacterium tibiigranuli]MCI2185609.1 hypothetical protein [Bifidobacterium tibiigranuli]
MQTNIIRSLGLAAFNSIVLLVLLVRTFSWLGLFFVAVVVAVMFAFAMGKFTDKNYDSMAARLNLFGFMLLAGYLAIQYRQFLPFFARLRLGQAVKPGYSPNYFTVFLALFIIMGTLTGQTLVKTAVKPHTASGQAAPSSPKANANNTSALVLVVFVAATAVAVMKSGPAAFLDGLPVFVFGFTVFGAIRIADFGIAALRGDKPAKVSPLPLIIGGVMLALGLLIPEFTIMNPASLSPLIFIVHSLLPWYAVAGWTVVLFFVSCELKGDEQVLDGDECLLAGLIGAVWVTATIGFAPFDLSWIIPVVYAGILLAVLFHDVGSGRAAEQFTGIRPLASSHYAWLLLAGALLSAAAVLVHSGHIYALLLAGLGALFAGSCYRHFAGWVRSAVMWSSVMLAVSLAFIGWSLQSGWNPRKLFVLLAMLAVTGSVTWMLNHHKEVGNNAAAHDVELLRNCIILILFVALSWVAAAKGNPAIRAVPEFQSNQSISTLGNATARTANVKGVTISAKAGTGNAKVKTISYVWANSYIYDSAHITKQSGAKGKIHLDKVKTNHLIIWARDSNGTIGRKDIWFYHPFNRDRPGHRS